MRFSTVFCVLASSAVAFAVAVPRDGATNVPGAVDSLNQQFSAPLNEFDNCAGDDCTKQAVTDLTTVLNTCPATVAPVPSGSPDDSDVSSLVAFVNTIVNKLESHKTSCGNGCPSLISNYAPLDQLLANCLAAFFNVRPGLMAKVSPQVQSLKSALQDIQFNQCLNALGLA